MTVRQTVLRLWPLARRLLGSPILWIALLLAALVLLMPSLRPAFAWAFPGIEPSVYERESFLVLLFSQAALVGASSLVSTVAGVGLGVFVTRPAGRDFRAIANALAAIGQTFPRQPCWPLQYRWPGSGPCRR